MAEDYYMLLSPVYANIPAEVDTLLQSFFWYLNFSLYLTLECKAL